MTFLLYMPYFVSANRGVATAQEKSLRLFEQLNADNALLLHPARLFLDRRYSTNEDRLPFYAQIWGKYDLLQVESTTVPTIAQINALMDCPHALCSQDYLTNIMLKDGSVFKFPAHKQIVHGVVMDIRQGCALGYPFEHAYLRYALPSEDWCDVSDLGIIKISQQFQLEHPVDFIYDDLGYRYNTVERLHQSIFRTGAAWHRHKELAQRNELFHIKNAAHESEYLTEQEMRKWLSLP